MLVITKYVCHGRPHSRHNEANFSRLNKTIEGMRHHLGHPFPVRLRQWYGPYLPRRSRGRGGRGLGARATSRRRLPPPEGLIGPVRGARRRRRSATFSLSETLIYFIFLATTAPPNPVLTIFPFGIFKLYCQLVQYMSTQLALGHVNFICK